MTQSLSLCAKSLNNPVLDIVSGTLTVTVYCLNMTQVDKQHKHSNVTNEHPHASLRRGYVNHSAANPEVPWSFDPSVFLRV